MQQTIQYLTEVTVAEITGRALSTLRNDRSIGRGIPYIKIGRSVRYDINDVVRFMEAHKIRTEDSVYLNGLSSSADSPKSENAAHCVFLKGKTQTKSGVLIAKREESLLTDAPHVEGGWNGPHIRGQKSLSRNCTQSEVLTTQGKENCHENL